MKKTVGLIALLLVMTLLLGACGSKGGSNSIEGTWLLKDITGMNESLTEQLKQELANGATASYTFKNGKFSAKLEVTAMKQTLSGDYKAENGKLIITSEGVTSPEVEYVIEGKTLKIHVDSDVWLIFTRK